MQQIEWWKQQVEPMQKDTNKPSCKWWAGCANAAAHVKAHRDDLEVVSLRGRKRQLCPAAHYSQGARA